MTMPISFTVIDVFLDSCLTNDNYDLPVATITKFGLEYTTNSD